MVYRKLGFLVLVILLAAVQLPFNRADRAEAAGWVAIPGLSNFIAAGGLTSMYATSTASAPSGGYYIYQWNGSSWVNIPGAAYVLGVATDGSLWAHQGNAIYHRIGTTWTSVPGAASRFAGGAGQMYATGINCNMNGDCGIFQYVGGGTVWQPIPGYAYRIAVSTDGYVWATQQSGAIYVWNGATWTGIPGLAKDIAAGGDGSVWAVGYLGCDVNANCPIYKWSGSGWTPFAGVANSIAVDSSGTVWARQSSGVMYHMP